ncbi:MAG TPA: hypothetical protein VIO60_01695 [Rectinemataceae bacterium]
MRKRLALLSLIVVLAVAAWAQSSAPTPASDRHGLNTIAHDYRPSAALSGVGWLSDYYPGLLGTPGDSRVYYFQGKKPGGTLFVGGGTHSNEIAGIMAAVLMVENLEVEAGRVIVVPNLNNSGVSHLDKEPGIPDYTIRGPAWIALDTPSGKRYFKYGSRCTHPAHQGLPDPTGGYVHPESSEAPLAGWEFRNLNRAYPGREDSGLTQKIALAVMLLLKREKVDVAFDYHEADIGGRLANMVVAHPKNIGIAAAAVLDVELDHGLALKLEPSNLEFRGLSHREWGASTQAAAFLVETPHPAMGADAAWDTDVVNDPRSPLGVRVATHLAVTQAVVNVFSDTYPERAILFTGLPTYENLVARGLGPYLK